MTAYLAPFTYNATVLEVTDGDTIKVRVSWGFYRYDEPIPVRLLGIAARELKDPGGKEARDNLAALLPAGTPVLLMTAKPDKYAPRWNAAVEYDNGAARGYLTDLSTVLIAEGWAAPWDGRGAQPKPAWPRQEIR